MRTPADLPRRVPRTSRRFRLAVLVAVVVVIIVLSTARGLARFYISYLWFQEVHFTSVFRGVLVTKVLLAVVFCVLFFIAMLSSLAVADRFAPKSLHESVQDELVERYRDTVWPHGRWVRVVAAAVFALFAGIGTDGQWKNWDMFRYHVPFHVSDPLFHRDVGFYVFELPFIKFLLGWGFGAVVVVLLVTGVAQYLNGGIRFQGSSPRVSPAVKVHLSVLFGLLAMIQAVGYYFQRFDLVLSRAHVVDGATNTEVHANLPADDLLIAIAAIAAVLFLVNIRVRGWILPVVAVVVWVVVWILVGNVYPAVYQALRVNPSELTRERPYIQRNIDATRQAYGLDHVKVVGGFNSDQTVSSSQIQGDSAQAVANRQTLANVQLLDPAQLTNTFEKIQALRSYYSINSLSVDRYMLDLNGQDSLTETLTGVRELNTSVPSGFTNSRLTYTHGYGAAVAPASEAGVSSNGYPSFTLQNVPPSGPDGGPGQPRLSQEGAQIYYGQGSAANGYVIVDSKQAELDYETPNGNTRSTHYAGSGGVPVGNFFRRVAFSVGFGNFNILLSGQVTGHSRVVFNRNILQRVEKAAPFLQYDATPYSVILPNGQLYWVVDGYTTTADYPYSEDADTSRVPAGSGLSGTFNYVRNSVKVVVNAYTGKLDFFVVDQSDPIIQVYERAFPDLFIPVSKADALLPGITEHFHYPKDLFEVQTNMYGRYHLTNAAAFYSQANAWNISQDPGSGRPGTPTSRETFSATGRLTFSVKELIPQYEVAALPGGTKQEFLLDQPFVPVSAQSTRQNLTAVMFASSDPSDYGQLTVYETPPGEQVNGPQLVTAEVNANTNISKLITLLNQGGSRVELGEVVVVPIADTLMYVQPVYVESTSNPVPELKDVIVVYDNAAYQSANASLDAALCGIINPDGSKPFSSYCNTAAASRRKIEVTPGGHHVTSPTTTVPTTPPPTTAPSPSGHRSVAQLLTEAQDAFAAAKAALASGNLGKYQSDVARAETDVAMAKAEEPGSPTTTVPRS
jgi:uncharacterized membrane protein (UPF0182 family)